jgi:two-component system, LytTR family, response regulator
MKYKAILIEDDPSTRLVIEKSLKEIQAPVELIGTYSELEEAMVPLSSQGIDLVFLDIELGGGVSGFDLFKTFPRPYFEVIFVTGHQKHALKAIQYACLDFLVKPITTNTLSHALRRLYERKQPFIYQERITLLLQNIAADPNQLHKIALPSKEGYIMQPLATISYFKADGNYAEMYTLQHRNPLFVGYGLSQLEQLLPPTFFRAHRSFLVHLNHVQEIRKSTYQLVMDDGNILDVSQRSLPLLLERVRLA